VTIHGVVYVGLMILCLALQQRVYRPIHYASQSGTQTGEQSISTEGNIRRHSFTGQHRGQSRNCTTVQNEFHQHVFRNLYTLNLLQYIISTSETNRFKSFKHGVSSDTSIIFTTSSCWFTQRSTMHTDDHRRL
jgi:hypothetical protein